MNNTKNVHCLLCAVLKPINELTNLQTDAETRQKVINKLSRFNIAMDFQQNILPKTVCLICINSLEQAFTFVTAVEQAQVLLNNIILIHIRTVENSTDCAQSYMPSDDGNEIIDIKVENRRDPMDLSDDDNSNVDAEEFNEEIKDIAEPSSIIEETINIKIESDENTDLKNFEDNKNDIIDASLDEHNDFRENHDSRENDFNTNSTIIPELKENLIKETLKNKFNSGQILPMENVAYCTDLVNKQNFSITDTNALGANVQHVEPMVVSFVPQVLDTTLYSEDYINKQISRLGSVPVQGLKKTWIDYEWKCSYCGTLFSNIEELQTHSIRFHNSCNSYQCTDCKIKKQRLNAFLKHVRAHRKYLHYSCYRCFEKFPKLTDTLQHKAKIHETSKYVCVGCNCPFSSNTELEEHVNKYYKSLWKKKTFFFNDNLTCDKCNKVCANMIALRNHLNTHKEKKRDHLCDRCGKCFDSDPSLRVHMETHSERVLYHCEICKTTFKTVYSLRYHSTIHSGIKPFACDICNKRFRNKQQIHNHVRHHMDYFPISCTICSKKFRTEVRLQNHMLQHTGEKPFSCDICPRDFTNLSNRNKHMRRKHGIEMAKKRQPIIKEQTADELTPEMAPGEGVFADLDKMDEWKNKTIELQRSKKTSKPKKPKVIVNDKECNEN